MLWAGDGKHGGVTDIRRLPYYDVYLCAGWQESLQDNINDLNDDQTLCALDVHNEKHLALFHYLYDGCFAQIDSDYFGNTPTLPITDYTTLLQPEGVAYNIQGINSLSNPEQNLYGMLELFAPILPHDARQQRRWCESVMELSKRDFLDPSMVWTSPDLKHPCYSYVKERQLEFENRQRMRSAAWPQYEETLRAQWEKADTKLLLTSLYQHYGTGQAILQIIMPHLSRFDEFLGEKIDELLSIKPRFTLVPDDYLAKQQTMGEDILSAVDFKQTVLRLIGISLPDGLRATIGFHRDERYPAPKTAYGLSLQKEPAPPQT